MTTPEEAYDNGYHQGMHAGWHQGYNTARGHYQAETMFWKGRYESLVASVAKLYVSTSQKDGDENVQRDEPGTEVQG